MDEKLFIKALRFLTLRSRTEYEVRLFLKKQNATEDQAETIIADLKKRKFINDEAFVKQWIGTRMRLKPKGWRVLEMELKQKGISEEIIEKYQISNIKSQISNEQDVVLSLVNKRIVKYKGKPREEIYRKLGGFLIRRGFSFHDSKKAIDEVLKNNV